MARIDLQIVLAPLLSLIERWYFLTFPKYIQIYSKNIKMYTHFYQSQNIKSYAEFGIKATERQLWKQIHTDLYLNL